MPKKTFLGLFSIEDTNKQTAAPQPNTPLPAPGTVSGYVESPPLTTTASQAAYTPPPPPTNTSSADNDKIKAHFDEVFKAANLPGPDYYEFKGMLEELIVDLPEQKAFQVAFKGLAKQGLTKQFLTESANHYLQILDNDAKETAGKIISAKTQNIDGIKQQAEDLKKKVEQQNAQLLELQQLIAKNQEQVRALNSQISENEQKIANRETGYQFMLQNKKNEINTDIQKINSYI